MKLSTALIGLSAALALAACSDNKQAQLEAQLKQQQEQLAQQQVQLEAMQKQGAAQAAVQTAAEADQTVYQLTPEAVNETLSAEAQAKGKTGEAVTGNDGQQYIYDQSSGSWLLQSLVGAAAGAFIGSALANKFTKAPQNSPAVQQARSHYAQQYTGKSPQAPASLSPRQQAAAQAGQAAKPQTAPPAQQANSGYRPTQQGYSNHQAPRKSGGFGFGGKRRR